MVRFYETFSSYYYSFPAVSLAYFLRYPNPYSRHVLSTDVIESYVDLDTQRLHTLRLHLKSSKLPSTLLRFIPKSVLDSLTSNVGQSYVLEKSVVDGREGWMTTESRNLEWTGVLSVTEKQVYRRKNTTSRSSTDSRFSTGDDDSVASSEESTDVETTVTLHSRLGDGKAWDRKPQQSRSSPTPIPAEADEPSPPKGFFAAWSTASLQSTIEMIGARRAKDQLLRSTEGMKLVLERLQHGGLVAVLEGMRKDTEGVYGVDSPWKRAWPKPTGYTSEQELEVKSQDD